jgi:hypothetical protein
MCSFSLLSIRVNKLLDSNVVYNACSFLGQGALRGGKKDANLPSLVK